MFVGGLEQVQTLFALKEPVVLLNVAHAFFGQQLQPPLHFQHGVPQGVGGHLGIRNDRSDQVRDAFIQAQLQAFGVHQDQLDFTGRRLEQDRKNEAVHGNTLARPGGAGDEQVRHGAQLGDSDAAVDLLAQRQSQRRTRGRKGLGFEYFAQHDGFPVGVRDLDADRGFSRNALDQQGLGFQRKAEVFDQVGDPVVLDACLGLELKRRNHRAGIDLRDRSADIKFLAFGPELHGQELHLIFRAALNRDGRLQQVCGGQLVYALRLRFHARGACS